MDNNRSDIIGVFCSLSIIIHVLSTSSGRSECPLNRSVWRTAWEDIDCECDVSVVAICTIVIASGITIITSDNLGRIAFVIGNCDMVDLNNCLFFDNC